MKNKVKQLFNLTPIMAGMALAAVAAAPLPAVAQGGGYSIEEIVVSARKRDESLTDVPDQIQVFGEQLIADSGIQNVTDVASLTPGLFYSGDQFPGLSVLTLRGISQAINSDAPIAFAVDGVTYANSLLFGQPLFDIQQIEVLRGPQGALYGRNSIGGAINITTKGAAEEPEGNVKLLLAEGSEYQIQASYAAPLSDTLSFRVTGSIDDKRGLIDNDVTGEDIDSRESQFGRINFNWRPGDTVSLDLRASKLRASGQGTRYRAVNIGLSDPNATSRATVTGFTTEAPGFDASNGFSGFVAVTPDNRVLSDGVDITDSLSAAEQARLRYPAEVGAQQPSLPDTDNSYGTFSAKLDIDFETFTFTSITDYTETRSEGLTAIHYHYLTPIIGEIEPESTDNFTQELRFTSSGDGALRWNTGVFYQKQEIDRRVQLVFGPLEPNFPQSCCQTSPFFDNPAQAENEVYAAFFQFNYDLSDDLELTVAGRYDRDERTQITQGLSETFDEFQPKISLGWDVTDDALVYTTYSTGFRSGGFNGSNNFGDPNDGFGGFLYEPETLDNYEFGFKTTWLDGTLQLNGAAYYIDYENQVQFLFVNGAQELVNSESSEVTGLELEYTYRPTANLTINGGLSVQDTEVQYPGSGVFGGVAGDPDNTASQDSFIDNLRINSSDDIDGGEFIFTPDYNFNLNIQYTGTLNRSVDYVLRAEYIRQGEMFFGIDNAVRARDGEFQDDYDLLNLRAGLEGQDWRVTAFLSNATDEFYAVHGWLGRIVGQEAGGITQGAPSQFGVEMEFNF